MALSPPNKLFLWTEQKSVPHFALVPHPWNMPPPCLICPSLCTPWNLHRLPPPCLCSNRCSLVRPFAHPTNLHLLYYHHHASHSGHYSLESLTTCCIWALRAPPCPMHKGVPPCAPLVPCSPCYAIYSRLSSHVLACCSFPSCKACLPQRRQIVQSDPRIIL